MRTAFTYVAILSVVAGADYYLPNFQKDYLVPLILVTGTLLGMTLIYKFFRPASTTSLQAPVMPQVEPETTKAEYNVLYESTRHVSAQPEKKRGRPKGSKNKRTVSSDQTNGKRHTIRLNYGTGSVRVPSTSRIY